MAIETALCNSYKLEILSGIHLASHTYKIALFTETAVLNKNTTSYLGLYNEVGNANGYNTGGIVLSGFTTSLLNDTAILYFTTNPAWINSSIEARGALIYNDSLSNKNAVAVFNFGKNYSSINETFEIEMPIPGETTALIKIT